MVLPGMMQCVFDCGFYSAADEVSANCLLVSELPSPGTLQSFGPVKAIEIWDLHIDSLSRATPFSS